MQDFWRTYLHPNRPALLTGLTSSWHCQREWVTQDGAPDCRCLREAFGAVRVQVADCSLPEEESCRLNWSLGQYLDYLDAHSVDGDARVLYCKDVHLVTESERRGLPEPYTTPELFADDWLNAYYDVATLPGETAQASDYRFTYLGPPGSSTPMHADVLRSQSWSTNLSGTKHWLLFPPDQAELLRDARGAFPADYNAALQCGNYPRIADAKPMELLVQEAGDTMFVPAGWVHQVLNVGSTPVLSVNHNWFGVTSLDITWRFLCDEMRLAEQHIEDIRHCTPPDEFDALVVRNTRANAGLDAAQFALLIWQSVRHRINAGESDSAFDKRTDVLACTRAAQVLRQMANLRHGLLQMSGKQERPQPDEWASALECWLANAI